MSWIGVLTNAGNALLAEWALGEKTLNITGASVGNGTVAQANMRLQTALASHKMAAAIAEKKSITNGVNLRVRLSPATAEVGAFTAHEIGIWANLDGGTDVLLSYHMDDDVGVSVPLASVSSDFFFDLNCPEVLSNNGDLNISLDGTVHVSNSQFLEKKVKDMLMAEGIENCRAELSTDENGNITGITHIEVDTEETIRTDTFVRNSGSIAETRTMNSGEILTITTDLTTKSTTYIYS